MTEVSTEPTTNNLRVRPQTLYADTPAGAAVYIERLYDTPAEWLQEIPSTGQRWMDAGSGSGHDEDQP
jgi:hypothetical protein